jgi:hypothetical protein
VYWHSTALISLGISGGDMGGCVGTCVLDDCGGDRHLDGCGAPLNEVGQLSLADALQALVHLRGVHLALHMSW